MKVYSIKNKDGRVVRKHKKYDRYYVRYGEEWLDDLKDYKTKDINKAKSVLEATKKNWSDDGWEIVEVEE